MHGQAGLAQLARGWVGGSRLPGTWVRDEQNAVEFVVMRRPYSPLLLLALICANPLHAQVRHDSPAGYSILPPKGWSLFSGDLAKEELQRLPEAVRNQYDPTQIDALFVDLSHPREQAFHDTLNILVEEVPLSLEEPLLSRLKAVLEDSYRKVFPDFVPLGFERVDLAGGPAVLFRARYLMPAPQREGAQPPPNAEREQSSPEPSMRPVIMHQFIVSGPARYLVLTCTFAAGREAERAVVCRRAAETLRFLAPQATEQRTAAASAPPSHTPPASKDPLKRSHDEDPRPSED